MNIQGCKKIIVTNTKQINSTPVSVCIKTSCPTSSSSTRLPGTQHIYPALETFADSDKHLAADNISVDSLEVDSILLEELHIHWHIVAVGTQQEEEGIVAHLERHIHRLPAEEAYSSSPVSHTPHQSGFDFLEAFQDNCN